MIQEYRKKTAEVLGIEVHPYHHYYPMMEPDNTGWMWFKNELGKIALWQPDKDLNQMLMIWYWLAKEKQVEIMADLEYYDGEMCYGCELAWHSPRKAKELRQHGDSMAIAFMKAFMEYIKTQEL
jgi:hypothetical protein